MNSKFIKSEAAQAWISQFDAADQPIAIELLRKLKLVSRDAFAERLRELIIARIRSEKTPVGLYVEREVPHRHGVPFRLFKEAASGVKRAYGAGPRPVEPTRAYDADVGSEGLIAHLVSEICREFPSLACNHPGPDAIRRNRVRRFLLITDFIGSGQRVDRYLSAAWRVQSVQSWWSRRTRAGLGLEVIAYAATQAGRTLVERHPSRPYVSVVIGCPTVDSEFRQPLQYRIREVCRKYAPRSSLPPLGYGWSGALVVFAHGAPNNSPSILHKGGAGWKPLFPSRVSSSTRHTFEAEADSLEEIRSRLLAMRQIRLAHADWLEKVPVKIRRNMFVLAALNRGAKATEAISRLTGLTVTEVESAIAEITRLDWIDAGRILTDVGRDELNEARRHASEIPLTLPPAQKPFYYPSSLRAPVKPPS